MAPARVVGVDVGGTKILAGIVDRDGRVLESHETATPEGPLEAVLTALDEAVEPLVDDRVAVIGYGIPSNLDRRSRVVLRSANLPLEGLDLLDHGRKRHGLPVGVENDANAATLAEWRLGAGRGAEDLVLLTLGTGVGGGLVLEGRLYRGWAELGHLVVQQDGPPCPCGGSGHLEALVSGSAADRAAVELFGPEAGAETLVALAESGDAAAGTALRTLGSSLGAAVGSFLNMFDPDVVVVGGGFGSAAGELILESARETARAQAIHPAGERLRLVTAELGAEAGLVGAGLVAFEALDSAW